MKSGEVRLSDKNDPKAFREPVWGALKMQDRKMQDWNLTDQIAGPENAGLENAGLEIVGLENVELENRLRLKQMIRYLAFHDLHASLPSLFACQITASSCGK